jgi:hypothetical protein
MAAPKKDAEIEAMGKVTVALDDLEEETRRRVIRWAAERYGVTLSKAARGPQQRQNDGDSDDEDEQEEKEFAEVGDLFSAAAPPTDEDRALIVAYWFQELEGQPNVTSYQVNKELKNLGHGANNITRVFDNLIATSPQLVIQTRKSGTSKQARKTYKVTKAGTARVLALLAGTAAALITE